MPGLTDGLGDRLLMFDNTGSASLELLRFRKEFSDRPGFESALRERIRHLEGFTHPSIGTVRAVKWLDDNDGLALVSDHVSGRRLSEILGEARGPGFALELIRQLTPALVALQEQGDGVAHGLLTPERIVVTPEGRLVLVEHVLGPAVETLELSPSRLRGDLGLAVPTGVNGQGQQFNERADVVQLGLIALSLTLGRRVDPRDYPQNIATLLDDFPRIAGRGSSSAPQLRMWLEQALQLGARTFGSAQDARDGLAGLPNDLQSRSDTRRMITLHRNGRPGAAPRETNMSTAKWPYPKGRTAHAHAHAHETFEEISAARLPPVRPDDEPLVDPLSAVPQFQPRPVVAEKAASPPARTYRLQWLTVAVAAIAVGEGVFIGGMLYARRAAALPTSGTITIESAQPGLEVLVDGRSVGVTPYKLDANATNRSIRVLGSLSDETRVASLAPPPIIPAPDVKAKTDAKPAGAGTPAGSSLGGLRVNSPLDLQIFEDGRLVGTTAGAVAMAVGRHDLEVVNEKFAYRSRQSVDVRPGQTTALSVTPPNGRISINAVPWAEVWISGTMVGETPLANFSLPLGEHEIVFRHPQLGERRQTAIVKGDGITRITANLQK
jgi:PEGA domain-containing protein